MAVIGHRQGLTALFTVLFQRDEGSLVRRFGARSSSSHALSPPGFFTRFLLLDYTSLQPQFAIQQKNELKPWQHESWCIPEVSAEFVAAMEDVLDLYEEEYDPRYPTVCFDEKLVTLHADVRPPQPPEPGQP
ncbi:hypothetical protein ccbrp13_62660 [Ktedonobacteria bacterium brp13]|nr:hypothetical protein ccbrp13_62660 [Ktedonobacteria bacterium brp13]